MSPILCKAPRHILFDLDGTLLPMDMDRYIQLYFQGLSEKLPHIAPEKVQQMLREGIKAMMYNQSGKTNREAFAEVFAARTGMDYYGSEDAFLTFYRTGYEACAAACQPLPLAGEIVRTLRQKGYTLTLATSPLYPAVATQARMRWAGLDARDFAFVTTFDDFHAAKPSLTYYQEVCRKLGAQPQDCLLIGNDVQEDGVAKEIGMQVIMVTDCIINKTSAPLDDFQVGTLEDVYLWARQLPQYV